MGLFVKGQIPWNKGKQLHYSVWNKGISTPPRHTTPHNEETKIRCSETQKERWALGAYKNRQIKYDNRKPIKKKGIFVDCAVCGKQFYCFQSEIKKNKRFCSKECNGIGMSREKHPMWEGGITPEKNRIRKCAKYKQWRRTIFIRDDFTCQECGKTQTYIMAHHVKPFSKYPNLIFDINNGITLCKQCHKNIHGWRSKNVKVY